MESIQKERRVIRLPSELQTEQNHSVRLPPSAGPASVTRTKSRPECGNLSAESSGTNYTSGEDKMVQNDYLTQAISKLMPKLVIPF